MLLCQLIRPRMTVVEVGANIGLLTVPFARFVAPGDKVIAFEPQRIPYYCLCANVVLNNLNNVLCHQVAVGEATGTTTVPELDYLAEDNLGGLELTSGQSAV